MSDIERIKEKERVARRLEPTPSKRREITGKVVEYAGEFLDKLYEKRTFVTDHDHGRGIYESPISDTPISIEDALNLIRQNVDEPALNPASGGHVGYIAGGGIYPSALGDYLADISNNFAGVYYVGPGAVRMEHMLIHWMAESIGFPDTAGGDLTSGGSIANLTGIVTARDAGGIKGVDVDKTVVYMTPHAHHSLRKALNIAGLRECIVRCVAMDERLRMKPAALEESIASDRKSGLDPWLVIASGGTVDAGAVDPLSDIADIAQSNGVWMHVDAAYGGFFALTEKGKEKLAGIERADSVVMDPHKGMFLAYGTGAILVRDRAALHAAHEYEANYMQDSREAEDEYSPAAHSAELTRHFRGMRFWLPLKLFGVAPFRACLEEKLLLADYFYEQIKASDGFEVGPRPELSVVTYRYVPQLGDADAFNRRLVDEIQKDGRVFITSTVIDGKVMLRLAALCFRTHLNHVDLALEILRDKARAIESET